MKISKAEIEAIIEASCRTFVPLHQLVLSLDHQARPAGSTSAMSIEELAASIQECGVLQNLIVVKGSRNSYEVCAGGRRLQALSLLVSAGILAENFPVPVLIVPADRGLIASLSENAFHVPMHPADEIQAFGKLLALGKSAEDVAAAFGVTALVVKRRMKLAAVSPKLIAQFRQDKISMECLMVLASVDDHARQEQAWAGLDAWNRHPDTLRRVLNQGEIESDRSPVAKYVTVAAYEKAGGPTRRDLFSDDLKKVYLLDALLLEQLAVAKLQRKAKQVAAQGWKWVDVRSRLVHDEYVQYGELRKSPREPNEAEAAELAGLAAELARCREQLEAFSDGQGWNVGDGNGDGEDEGAEESEEEGEQDLDSAEQSQKEDAEPVDEQALAQLETECEELNARIVALKDSLSVWPPELMAHAGCVVYVGSDARAAVRHGLIRPDDRGEMAQAVKAARSLSAGQSGQGTHHGGGNMGDDTPESDLLGNPFVSMPSGKARAVHSERLTRNLTAYRVAAIQAELLGRPDIAVAALTAQLAGKLLLDGYRQLHGNGDALTFNATDTHGVLSHDAEDIVGSAAWLAVEAQRQHWRERLPEDIELLLPWMLAQDAATVTQLLTFLVASSVTGVHAAEPQAPRQQRTEAIARALNLDMTKWWHATATSYFNHVSKTRIAEVVTEAAGVRAAVPLQALKKEAAASGAEQAMATVNWLPTVLRLRPSNDAGRESASQREPGDANQAPGGEGLAVGVGEGVGEVAAEPAGANNSREGGPESAGCDSAPCEGNDEQEGEALPPAAESARAPRSKRRSAAALPRGSRGSRGSPGSRGARGARGAPGSRQTSKA